MAKIVLVESGPRLATLTGALRSAGHEVVVAGSGSLALTALERLAPDLVITSADSTDMTGWELCSIMRADPAGRERPVLLLADGPIAGSAATAAGVDSMLSPSAGLPEILEAVETMLLGRGRLADAAANPPSAVGADDGRALQRAPTFRGSLGVMDMAEVAQAIAIAGKTGRLTVSLSSGEGIVWFVSGRAVHAEFRRLESERAFRALVAAAHGESDGSFCFNPVKRDETMNVPRTITRSVDQLLLIVAADIDARPVTPGTRATVREPQEER
jgi:CheY-like chemotaxis protein